MGAGIARTLSALFVFHYTALRPPRSPGLRSRQTSGLTAGPYGTGPDKKTRNWTRTQGITWKARLLVLSLIQATASPWQRVWVWTDTPKRADAQTGRVSQGDRP